MQKFIIVIAKILLTLLVLLIVLDWSYTTVYLHSSKRGKVEKVFNSKAINYDVVILGSSRANNHFVPELFEKKGLKTFNYGMSGAHLFEASLMLKLMAERNYKIKTVILEADLGLCNEKESEMIAAKFLPYIHHSETIKNHFSSQGNFNELYYIPFYRYIYFDALIGFREMYNTATDKPTNILDNQGYHPLASNKPGNMKNDIRALKPIRNKYYEEIKQICKQNNYNLIAVMTPMCSNVKGLDYFYKANKIYPEIHNLENVVQGDHYFSSCGHMNDAGARMFTEVVIEKFFETNKNNKMANNTKTIRWGILGCGNVTEVKSGPAYQKTAGFKIEAVMRRDAKKAGDYALRHNISKYYSDADALINDPEIDAIYIATPPDTHHLYGLKVALAGKICCIEKPLAPSYAASLEIYEAFKAKNIPLFTAYYRRSLPRFEQIKTWLDNNKIGEVRSIRWNLTKSTSEQDLSGTYNWRTDAKVAPGGYFDDLASHGLDLFIHLLGNIKEVSGFSLNQQGLYSAKDAITACWLHESGITGNGNWNFGSQKREDFVEITGSKGKITFSIFENDPIVLSNDEGETELFIENPENVQLYHVERIREQLLGNSIHPSNGLTASHTSWVMDKILGNLSE